MDSHFIEQVVSSYGYLALFVGTFLEGETFFLLGGIAARKDLLNPFYVAMAAMAGGFVGDQFFFSWAAGGATRSLACRAGWSARPWRRACWCGVTRWP